MSRETLYSLCLLVVAVATAGCAGLAEDVATHLATHDVKAIDHDLAVFKTDLALFRECLKERGGSCQGNASTALPHSAQHAAAQPAAPVEPGSSQTLAAAVRQLPATDPARTAHAVLSHPVVKQAAAVHNHLRGHGGATAPGVTVTTGKTAGGTPTSTVTMDLKLDQGAHLHHSLLTSIGDTAWDSLHKHCRTLTEKHRSDADLAADCRRASFIRGYLGAYFRHGEFLDADVQLAGVIRAVNDEAAKIEAKIASLQSDVAQLEQTVTADQQQATTDVGTDAGQVGSDVRHLLDRVRTELSRHFGPAVGDVLSTLASLGTELETAAQQLAGAAASSVETDISRLATRVNHLLGRIDTELGKLKTKVQSVDQTLVNDIDNELQKADSRLSNVFKVSNVGFVSRDATFRARLPTLEVILDPNAGRLLSVEDVDTGQTVTGKSDLGALGVATDTSGVGTGDKIGAELLRVFLEAIFDAGEGLPAVYPANTTDLKPTGLTLGADSLPTFTAPMGNVDAGDLTKMTHLNDQAATQTRVILGRVIEGIGPFSLDNRALEAFLVELVATSVRKAAEKATWCFYACNLNVDFDRLRTDVGTAVEDKVKAEEHKAEAKIKAEEHEAEDKAKEAEHKAKAWAQREVEEVRLRLRLSR